MKKFRIWFQGATDRAQMAPYIDRLEPHLKKILDPGFRGEFHSTTPPATTTHALTEFRIARAIIRGAVQAEREGYDAVAITHFQDAGLAEAKSAVGIPVLGLGETTLFHALTLGRKLGLVTINPQFVPWHEDQVIRYGIQSRVVGVRAVNAKVSDFMEAFATKEGYKRLYPLWEREVKALLEAGADVIVPAGGLPMMLYAGKPGASLGGAPIINGITVLAKTTELRIKLQRLQGTSVSRRSNYARPPARALKEFLEQG